METTSESTRLKLEAELEETSAKLKQGGPGRIGVYERPAETSRTVLMAIIVGFIALIIAAMVIYVQFFMV